ncbi:hypothetical protein SAMN02745126_03993 [Enhydrobacter aerosaccus]|uniref:Uncharacterized protein n=1 Tax=Enhydrobacter aerosaccus TaxID=225324 RepID=A0A1T4RP69_9HYPH|nr:hypothetical protein SAMN02745126_03993 [Enhydrobacter aerosaccus]
MKKTGATVSLLHSFKELPAELAIRKGDNLVRLTEDEVRTLFEVLPMILEEFT